MELGYDAILLNTAIAKAGDPVAMARAFALGVEAGRIGFRAGAMRRATWPRPRRRCIGRPSRISCVLDPFYMIVDSSDWIARLLPCGVRLVQLRDQGRARRVLRAEIREAKALCAAAGAQLIVNDYWRHAIEAGCDFIHLGQSDLDDGRPAGDPPRGVAIRRLDARQGRT